MDRTDDNVSADGYNDGVQPVFRLRALGLNLNSGSGSNLWLYSEFLHRSGCLQDVHGGMMQKRLRHLSGTDAQDAAPDEQ